MAYSELMMQWYQDNWDYGEPDENDPTEPTQEEINQWEEEERQRKIIEQEMAKEMAELAIIEQEMAKESWLD